jgi:hypothetical protein
VDFGTCLLLMLGILSARFGRCAGEVDYVVVEGVPLLVASPVNVEVWMGVFLCESRSQYKCRHVPTFDLHFIVIHMVMSQIVLVL